MSSSAAPGLYGIRQRARQYRIWIWRGSTFVFVLFAFYYVGSKLLKGSTELFDICQLRFLMY